jgi:hypothetical protein
MLPLSIKSRENLSLHILKTVKQQMTEWYFNQKEDANGGGFFLTESSQKEYGKFIDKLDEIMGVQSPGSSAISFENIPDDKTKAIKYRASLLRTKLCKDVGVREDSLNPSPYDDIIINIEKEKDDTVLLTVTNFGFQQLKFPRDFFIIILPLTDDIDKKEHPLKVPYKKNILHRICNIFRKDRILLPYQSIKFYWSLKGWSTNYDEHVIVIKFENVSTTSHFRISNLNKHVLKNSIGLNSSH